MASGRKCLVYIFKTRSSAIFTIQQKKTFTWELQTRQNLKKFTYLDHYHPSQVNFPSQIEKIWEKQHFLASSWISKYFYLSLREHFSWLQVHHAKSNFWVSQRAKSQTLACLVVADWQWGLGRDYSQSREPKLVDPSASEIRVKVFLRPIRFHFPYLYFRTQSIFYHCSTITVWLRPEIILHKINYFLIFWCDFFLD